MEVVVGTYEEFLVGYTLKRKRDQYQLVQSFTNHAHCGSVRSIANSSKYLVSGSIDEVIHIISMKHRIDSGTLVSHTGTITALEFLRSAYLFSASEDGTICIWNTRKWECEKILRGHKDAVNSLSIHSSGKLLISVSRDKTLRTWNLVKGRCAYIVNLKDNSHQVLWSPSGVHFAVVFDDHVDVYDISTGGVLHSIEKKDFDKRINKVLFVDDNTVMLCGDCNEVMIYDLTSKSVISRFTAHENRIKDMAWVYLKTIDPELVDQEAIDENARWLVTTSSDGFIKVWSLDFCNLEANPTLVTQVNTTCRPTCLTVWTSHQNPNGKFTDFAVPELKISKEELEVCKSKIREKKSKRKLAEEVSNGEKEELMEENAKEDEAASLPPKPKRKKKAKLAKQVDDDATEMPTPQRAAPPVQSDDDDDEEAIRNMKASSKVLKQVGKFKKSNKRNITTFKMRLQQKRAERENKKQGKASGFKVSETGGPKRNGSAKADQNRPHHHQKGGKFQQRRNNSKQADSNRPLRTFGRKSK